MLSGLLIINKTFNTNNFEKLWFFIRAQFGMHSQKVYCIIEKRSKKIAVSSGGKALSVKMYFSVPANQDGNKPLIGPMVITNVFTYLA